MAQGQLKSSRCSLREISALPFRQDRSPGHPVRQPGAKRLEVRQVMVEPARMGSRDRSPDEEEQSSGPLTWV